MKGVREIGLYFEIKKVALNQYLAADKKFQLSFLVDFFLLIELVDFDFLVT